MSLAHLYPSAHTADEFWARTVWDQNSDRKAKNTKTYEGIVANTVGEAGREGGYHMSRRGGGNTARAESESREGTGQFLGKANPFYLSHNSGQCEPTAATGMLGAEVGETDPTQPAG